VCYNCYNNNVKVVITKGGYEKLMTEIEKLITQVGELVWMEINEVKEVNYKRNKKITSFYVIMLNGSKYILNLKAV